MVSNEVKGILFKKEKHTDIVHKKEKMDKNDLSYTLFLYLFRDASTYPHDPLTTQFFGPSKFLASL